MNDPYHPAYSALVCYPVEWLDFLGGKRPPFPNLHTTLFHIPDAGRYGKDLLLETLRSEGYYKKTIDQWHRVVEVTGINAFGDNDDIPVLTLDYTFEHEYIHLKAMLLGKKIEFRTNFTYTPHVTVDLRTLVNPPKEVLLRPAELWYRDEDPVVV